MIHSTTAEYPLFLSPNGIFTKIDYSLGHKTNFNKFEKLKLHKACSWIIAKLN